MKNIFRAKIYKMEPPLTQSGKKNLNYWILEPEINISNNIDSLTGWSGGGDVKKQIRMKFSTLKKAEDFAKKNEIVLEYLKINERSFKNKSYAENFK